jgi:hypothetical protein
MRFAPFTMTGLAAYRLKESCNRSIPPPFNQALKEDARGPSGTPQPLAARQLRARVYAARFLAALQFMLMLLDRVLA